MTGEPELCFLKTQLLFDSFIYFFLLWKNRLGFYEGILVSHIFGRGKFFMCNQ